MGDTEKERGYFYILLPLTELFPFLIKKPLRFVLCWTQIMHWALLPTSGITTAITYDSDHVLGICHQIFAAFMS